MSENPFDLQKKVNLKVGRKIGGTNSKEPMKRISLLLPKRIYDAFYNEYYNKSTTMNGIICDILIAHCKKENFIE